MHSVCVGVCLLNDARHPNLSHIRDVSCARGSGPEAAVAAAVSLSNSGVPQIKWGQCAGARNERNPKPTDGRIYTESASRAKGLLPPPEHKTRRMRLFKSTATEKTEIQRTKYRTIGTTMNRRKPKSG